MTSPPFAHLDVHSEIGVLFFFAKIVEWQHGNALLSDPRRDGKHIGQVAVIFLCPDMRVIAGIRLTAQQTETRRRRAFPEDHGAPFSSCAILRLLVPEFFYAQRRSGAFGVTLDPL